MEVKKSWQSYGLEGQVLLFNISFIFDGTNRLFFLFKTCDSLSESKTKNKRKNKTLTNSDTTGPISRHRPSTE